MKPFLREKVPVNFEDIPDTTSKMYRVFELLPLLPRWSDIQKRR